MQRPVFLAQLHIIAWKAVTVVQVVQSENQCTTLVHTLAFIREHYMAFLFNPGPV